MKAGDLAMRSLVEFLRMRDSATVPSIAAHLRVPAPTVAGMLYRLMRRRAVCRSQTIAGKRGRPRINYRLRLPGIIYACHWDGTVLSGALFDENTTALTLETRDTSSIKSLEQAVVMIESLLDEMIGRCRRARGGVQGVALSVNAVNVGGRAVTSSVVPWANEHLGESLANALALPVRVLRHSLLLAAYRMLPDPPPRSMCLLNVGDGVSAHAIESGQRLLGRHWLAGELGHIVYEPGGLRCGCGRQGCLETVCSGPAIRRRVLRELDQGAKSELSANELVRLPVHVTIERLWEAWECGDAFARSAMEPTLDALAWGLGLVVNLLDPDVVATGGYVLQDRGKWMQEIEKRARPWILHAAKRDAGILRPAQVTLEDAMRVLALGFHPQIVVDELVVPSDPSPRRRGKTNGRRDGAKVLRRQLIGVES